MNSLVNKWGEQVLRSQRYAASLALVFATLSFFDLPVGWLSSVILSLVTLQHGLKRGLFVLSWAILPAVAMFCLGQFAVAINVILLHYILVLSFALILRRYNSWAMVLQCSALLAIVSVIVLYFFFPELQTWLISQLQNVAKEYQANALFNVKQADIDTWIQYFSLFAIGFFSLVIVLTNVMTTFLARWWQASLVPAVNLQKECYQVRLHYLTAVLLVIFTGGLYINESLFLNLVVAAMMPFVFCGISLLHSLSALKKNGKYFLLIFYALFLLFSPYVVVFLAMVGWLDSFLHIRRKFAVEDPVAGA